MKSWIITGGVGSGKSTATRHLTEVFKGDVQVFSSDEAVHHTLTESGTISELMGAFGSEVVNGGGVDRDWIRRMVFPDRDRKLLLEKILHPKVLEALEASRKAAAKEGSNLFLAEVPLHYEIGATVSADFVIVVASSRSVQVRRMMETRGLDEQTVRRFLEAQWPIEAKVERADAVIWNDGSLASFDAQMLTLARTHLQA